MSIRKDDFDRFLGLGLQFCLLPSEDLVEEVGAGLKESRVGGETEGRGQFPCWDGDGGSSGSYEASAFLSHCCITNRAEAQAYGQSHHLSPLLG